MFEYAEPLHALIEELRRIPGIGAKTAQRMAFYFLGLPTEDVDRLAQAIREAKRKIFYCGRCNNITHVDPCLICSDPHRSDEALCVVEEPFNISSIERTGAFGGRYHVLLGALSPLKGRGPDELRLGKLVKRIEEGAFKEIIIATNPTVEGEATALLLHRALKDFGIRMTRLAMGLPVGSDLDFADQVTIKKALEGRTDLRE
ncbi:MAG TPA: recombination protein RecR [Candidatus Aminicenantes bacterium]|nr:recombination protein RecR [Candidatus Aminicenantes bacterium]HDT13355.1 recombination protein RecR [Candidatus Aminicenantes bacterium]